MAIASGAASVPAGLRWAAVATALLPEESALSLEHEMQKAFAALAASEMAYAPSALAVAETPVATAPSSVEAPVVDAPVADLRVADSPVNENSITPPTTVPPQAVQSENTLGSERAEPIRFAATNFEIAATPIAESHPVVPPTLDSAPMPSAESIAEPFSTPPVAEEAKAEQTPVAAIPLSENASQEVSSPLVEPVPDQKPEEQKYEESQPVETVAAAAPASEAISESISVPDPSPTPLSEAPAEPAPPIEPASQVSSEPAAVFATIARAEAIVQQESAQTEPVLAEPAHKEPDIAATTAAAWATWRRIRESGDSKGGPASAQNSEKNQEEKNETSMPHDAAAMAAAAGAEKAPDGTPASDSDPSEIANIVDSVLADLRPKIVAEISKKMGKKK